MQKYVKINENGELEYAPQNQPGISNWINDEDAVLAEGYLPLEELNTPNGKCLAGYKVVAGKVTPVFNDLPEPTYVEQRMAAYPSFSDQLDMIYWDKINGTNLWLEQITAIKKAYPKPEFTEDDEQ